MIRALTLALLMAGTAFGQQYRIVEYDNSNTEIFSVKDDGDVSIANTLILFGGADITALSTGGADNDKLVTQGYVDDAAVADHGGLTGLTDDDHTQYALLLGRAGSQTIIGGTGTTDDLILQATSSAGATTGSQIKLMTGVSGGTNVMKILRVGEHIMPD